MERAAASSVTARERHPVTLSLASASAPRGAQGPPVTLTAAGAPSGRAVPCAVTVGVGWTVTPSVGSATVWTATWGPHAVKVGPPCSRACLQPRTQLPPDQPLADQRPGPAAGQTGTSSEAAPTRTRPPSASTGTQGLWCSQGGQPWAGTPDLALSLRTVDSLTLQGLCGCDKRSPWPSSAEPWRVDWTSRCIGCLG